MKFKFSFKSDTISDGNNPFNNLPPISSLYSFNFFINEEKEWISKYIKYFNTTWNFLNIGRYNLKDFLFNESKGNIK